jgi:hypothetical protein
MAFHTLEIRWFFSGSIPHDFNHWFTSLGESRSVDARVDHYLAGTGPLLGIKVREGSLEIKQRQQHHGRQDFAPALSGMVESWTKWRVAIPYLCSGSGGISQEWRRGGAHSNQP